MTAQCTQPFPIPLLPPGKICSSPDCFDQVMAHMSLGCQELVQVLRRNPLISNYRRFTIKQASKSSTNIIPRKSSALLGRRSSVEQDAQLWCPRSTREGPALPQPMAGHQLLTSRDNWLQTALFVCLLCLTVEVTDLTFKSNLDFHALLASPDEDEKALRPCCPPLSKVFWVASLVLVSRAALTHIINHFLLDGGRMGDVWVGHILEGLSATKGSSGETRQVTASAVQCPHLTFPPPGGRGGSVTFVTHFGVGNGHGSAKYHTHTASYIPSNISEDWTVNNDSPRTDKGTNPISVLLRKNEIHRQYLQNNK